MSNQMFQVPLLAFRPNKL